MSGLVKKIKESDEDLFIGLAGPGTGKTHSFKEIIENPYFSDKKILVLTFITRLVDDMKGEFDEYENVKVSTLHAFAREIIISKTNCEKIDFDPALDSIITEDYYCLKGEKVEFDDLLYENDLGGKQKKFFKARRDFYGWRENELHSFNSMIFLANLILKANNSAIPDKYSLVLIDEFQDFNKLEHKFIELLNRKNKIVAVGDDDQSLYDWKKAKPDYIRNLYEEDRTQNFTFDDCYRCPRLIIDATNSLIENAKKEGYLTRNKEKDFKYPQNPTELQEKVNEKYKIDFSTEAIGNKLICKLARKIKKDIDKVDSEKEDKKVLVITPHYLKDDIFNGLMKRGLNVVNYKPFSEEKISNAKNKDRIDTFEILSSRKTDNLALRKILSLYLDKDEVKKIIKTSDEKDKGLWGCLSDGIKEDIEHDINIFKKAKAGEKRLKKSELERLNKIINLKNVISRTIKGFHSFTQKGIEVEVSTAMSSKGLSANFVYYILS
ncbi:MAG: UvrD-helicase domain-containing protein [Candidatus Woesearchaeota archaeon]